MRHACRDVHDIALGDCLGLAILYAASFGLALAVGFPMDKIAAGDQHRLSPGNEKDVIVMRMDFRTAACRSNGKLDGV